MESRWHLLSLDDIAKEFKANFDGGLSQEEAVESRKKYGANKLPKGKKLHWWQLFFRQLKSPLVFILLIAAGMTFWLDELIDMSVILMAVSVNVLIGFWQEFRSNRVFEKLQAIVKVEARVKRGGKTYDLSAEELVPGDIILLKSGMKVPADARIISLREFEVNEALLTGESDPVKKELKMLSGSVSIGDRTNMVFTGTVVEKGDATAVVVATGANTEIGQIAALTANVEEEATPLQERLGKLGKIISIFVVISAALILITGLYEGRGFVEMFTVAVAVAVAAIPEGLPAALSVILAVSVQRILKKDGLVKKLLGAETLGSTTVICTDKTGTLTEGKMKVDNEVDITDRDKALRILALANEAILIDEDGKVSVKGETTDKAKMEYFLEQGGDLNKTLSEYPRLALLSFDDEKKYIASFHSSADKSRLLYVTGATENLLQLSSLDPVNKARIQKEMEESAKRGFRMIGIAERVIAESDELDLENTALLRGHVNDLSFIGMVAIRDPIRSDVPESVATTREAGIKIVMVTGDHKFTARAIGQELGFCDAESTIIDGEELEHMSDEDLREKIKNVNIFARVNPSHKMRIVEALKANGEVVAMTGDGVNDAPALKASDIGVAIGSGTDIAKEASDLILLNDSFSIITNAIKQGRIAFDNMRKVVVFLMMGSFTELILVMSSLIFKLPLAITAVMILWANIVEDGFPNFALAFEPGEDDVMKRKPLKRTEPILDRESMILVYAQGLVTDLILVGIFILMDFYSHYSLEHLQTVIFAALATDALLIVFSLKNLRKSIFQTALFNNWYLIFAVLAGMITMMLAIYTPFLNRVLGTVPLNWYDLVLVFGLGLFKVFCTEVIKWWFRKKEFSKLQASAKECIV